MIHAILMILLIILVALIIDKLSPGLLVKLGSAIWQALKGILKFAVVMGIIVGVAATIYNTYETKKQEERAVVLKKEQDEWAREELKRIEVERAERERKEAELAEAQRQAEEQRLADYNAKQAKIVDIEHYGPDNLNDWEWHLQGKTTRSEDYYISWNQTRYLQNDRNKKQFWLRTGNNILSRFVVDCNHRTSRMETLMYYDNFGKRGSKNNTDFFDRPFTPIDTATIAGDLANQICRKFN